MSRSRGLFNEAVLQPFPGFLEESSDTWRQQRNQSWDDVRLMSALQLPRYPPFAR